MERILIAALVAAAGISMTAQTTTRLSATKANDYGVVYSLPVTAIDITIETEHVLHEPGEFYNYARRYLGIDNAVRTPMRQASVKSVVMSSRGEASDTATQWLMQFKAGAPVYVVLDGNGVPVAINTENIPAMEKPVLPQAVAAEPTPLEVPAARQAVTQEMSQSSSTAKRAELASARIFELREQRNDLISGQADNTPPDGRSMQLALDNLTAQEAALTAMFVGTEKRWTQIRTLTFTPSDDVTNHILCRLSATEGIVDADDLSGEPIYISVAVTDRGSLPVDDKGVQKTFPKGGVAYCIPGAATVSVGTSAGTVASRRFDIAQLGVTFGLDPKLFSDKKAPYYLLLNPATGAISVLGVDVQGQ